MSEKLFCSHCGAEIDRDEMFEFDGAVYCADCIDELTTLCDCCNTRIRRGDVHGDGETELCGSCYDSYYTTCEDCGVLLHNDDAYFDDDNDYPYCHNCYEKLQQASIKSYNYKPEPIFYGTGPLFMGVELEIDKGGEDIGNADDLLDVANRGGEHIYCKHDGSISNGFEIVSHPMTLEYHKSNMNWQEVFENAVSMNYRSHQTSTCGLHVHINRTSLGRTLDTQEDVISRIVYFVENHWNELLKFSRRTEENINRWANRYGISITAKDTYKNAKNKHMGRYVAVNLENYDTIEFRIFRGTLRYKTFIAVLQLVYEICRFAIQLDDKGMEGMSWSEFVSLIPDDKPELIEYLKSKRLYINEILSESEEI
mgnify:FL=1